MPKLRIIKISAAVILISAAFQSCYYDNKQELYPLATGVCDTAAISYSKHIAPIMATYCNASGCHNTASGSAGIKTDNYADLKTAVEAGRFLGAIKMESGYSPMPKGGVLMSSCNLSKIQAWINAKMPNN